MTTKQEREQRRKEYKESVQVLYWLHGNMAKVERVLGKSSPSLFAISGKKQEALEAGSKLVLDRYDILLGIDPEDYDKTEDVKEVRHTTTHEPLKRVSFAAKASLVLAVAILIIPIFQAVSN